MAVAHFLFLITLWRSINYCSLLRFLCCFLYATCPSLLYDRQEILIPGDFRFSFLRRKENGKMPALELLMAK